MHFPSLPLVPWLWPGMPAQAKAQWRGTNAVKAAKHWVYTGYVGFEDEFIFVSQT